MARWFQAVRIAGHPTQYEAECAAWNQLNWRWCAGGPEELALWANGWLRPLPLLSAEPEWLRADGIEIRIRGYLPPPEPGWLATFWEDI